MLPTYRDSTLDRSSLDPPFGWSDGWFGPIGAWTPIPYKGGLAAVAETLWRHPRLGRIIVRRVKNIDTRGRQQALFAEWKTIAFVTDRAGDVVVLDREHRQRAARKRLRRFAS